MSIPIIKPGESPPPDAAFAYMTARNGHYLWRNGPWFRACVKVPELPTLPKQEEFYRFLGPKIPAALFSAVLAFFETVRLLHKTEAAVLLAFKNGRWEVMVPDQETTSTSVKYESPPGRRLAGSIHSHPGMSGRFSSTDEKDEAAFDGIHIVVGSSGFVRPEVSVAAVVSGRRIDLDPEDIIDGFNEGTDFPSGWLDCVRPEMGQRLLFEEPDMLGDRIREINPVCSCCRFRASCDIEPPEIGELCHLFEPVGSEESRR